VSEFTVVARFVLRGNQNGTTVVDGTAVVRKVEAIEGACVVEGEIRRRRKWQRHAYSSAVTAPFPIKRVGVNFQVPTGTDWRQRPWNSAFSA
jgi:hypothetical protein